jgi:uncharacterized secreted protein with C-terminal beta-propeller domain
MTPKLRSKANITLVDEYNSKLSTGIMICGFNYSSNNSLIFNSTTNIYSYNSSIVDNCNITGYYLKVPVTNGTTIFS